jgi:UDP-3-O-[3-hydroxymyristoyl] glucosamine N-acyltransferase
MMGGQTGSSGHLTIHKGATVYAQSGVGHDVPEGTTVSGSPAFEARHWIRAATAFQRLPDLLRQARETERRVKELESRLKELESRQGNSVAE